MSKWQPMITAPRDGTWIQAIIPGHGSDNVIAWGDDLVGEEDERAGGWFFATEQEPPDCWTNGICWAVNADGKRSRRPTRWKPLPQNTADPFGREVRGPGEGL